MLSLNCPPDRLKKAAILLAITLFCSVTVSADVVTDWNARAVQYSGAAGRPGPSFVIDVAVVQAAIYDAVQAIEGDYQPLCASIPGASGSTTAAAATAARDVLLSRFTSPAQTMAIQMDYANYVSGIDPADPGFDVGHAAAACIIEARESDGSFPDPPWPPFIGGTEAGMWRPTPSAPFAAEWLGFMTPFTMRSASQFRSGPPPDLNSPQYTRDYNEVKNYGGSTSDLRSPDQLELAKFWNGNFPAQMYRLSRDLAASHMLSVSESSRLLALVDLSMADGTIAAWDCKRHYLFWRPVTAIQNGNDDGNPKTAGDATWNTFLGTTPPYPDYTSGANVIIAAGTRAMSLYFDSNEMDFTINTTNTGSRPPIFPTRSYHKFSEVRDEVVEARIIQGIHFRFADVAARKQGEHIAQWANSHYFRPVEE